MGSVTFYKSPSDLESGKWYPDSSGIKNFTEDRVDAAIAHRDNVLQKLSDKLEELSDGIIDFSDLTPISAEISGDVLAYLPGAFNPQTPPTRPTLDTTYPTAPADAVLGSVSTVVLDQAPTFTATEPTLRDITAPERLTTSVPVAPSIPNRDGEYPDTPQLLLPDVPTARLLNLPAAPTLVEVDFGDLLPPELPNPPSAEFQFTENEYQSALSTQLKSTLLNLVLNTAQTGLSDAVLQQVWDKAREKTTAAMQGVVDNIARMYARAGWELPQGDQVESTYKALEDMAAADVTESRNIAVTEAELEQKNFQFAFTQALALEGQWITYHSSIQQRALESAKYAVQALIDLFQVQTSYFNSGVTLFTAQSQVRRDRIQFEIAKLEKFKTELEGQKLIGDLNDQDINRYTAQLKGVEIIADIFQKELTAVKTKLEGDEIKIRRFESEIRGFAETVRAKGLEYEGYRTELSGEELRANFFSALSDSFAKRVAAANGSADIKLKKLDADIKIAYDVPLKVLEQQTAIYKAKTDAKTAEIAGLVDIYKADAQVFGTEVTAEATRVNAEVAELEAVLKYYGKKVDVELDVFKANLSTLITQKEIINNMVLNEAKLRAQIAASIGGAVNFSAGISGSSAYQNATPIVITT